jgi:hypothetical protein
MPFSGPASYLPTIDEFVAHWTDVNAALAPNPLVLPSGYAIADLQADRTELATEMTELQTLINNWDSARTNRDNLKEPLHGRMKQLSNYIRGIFPESENFGQLRPLVDFSANEGLWINHMDKSASTWLDINTDPPAGFTPPLLLFGGYTQAMFAADVVSLKALFTEVTVTLKDARNQRALRDQIFNRVYDELTQYRLAVIALLPEDHALVQTIPRLEPLPGHTPDPVHLDANWDATEQVAALVWTTSDDEDLVRYDIRACIGADYDTDFEFAVDSTLPGVTTYETSEGLETPGATRTFKVYVILDTGNEAGSNAETVQNPGLPPPP